MAHTETQNEKIGASCNSAKHCKIILLTEKVEIGAVYVCVECFDELFVIR